MISKKNYRLLLFSAFFTFSFCLSGFAENLSYDAGGIRFSVPEDWEKAVPSSQMRLYEFTIPSREKIGQPAEMTVFYFGPGQGGSVQSNIDRWVGQFNTAENPSVPVLGKKKVRDMEVTTLFVEGTYVSAMPMMARMPLKEYAMYGAVVEGPKGLVFFKLTGPRVTVQSAQEGFENLVNSFVPVP